MPREETRSASKRILGLMLGATLFLTVMGALSLYLDWASGGEAEGARRVFIRLFDLNEEANVPTWYSTLGLLFAASLLFLLAGMARRDRPRAARRWGLLGAIFVFLAVDEAAQIHERVTELLRAEVETTGALRFAWVIPYAVACVVLAALYFRFLLRLPAHTRRGLVLAAALFGTGALGLELVEGYAMEVTGHYGALVRAVCIVEECLEMAGVAVFVSALWQYRESQGGGLRPTLAE